MYINPLKRRISVHLIKRDYYELLSYRFYYARWPFLGFIMFCEEESITVWNTELEFWFHRFRSRKWARFFDEYRDSIAIMVHDLWVG